MKRTWTVTRAPLVGDREPEPFSTGFRRRWTAHVYAFFADLYELADSAFSPRYRYDVRPDA